MSKDVIFSIDENNSLTILNGKDKSITINNQTKVYNDPTEKVLDKKDSGKQDFSNDSKIITIDGSKTTKGVEIVGNSNDNTIIAGKGKDILTGGDGADMFVYTAGYGNDTISDYSVDDGDIIRLGKKSYISAAKVVDDDYVFTISGKNKLTVADGASKMITFVDDDDNYINFGRTRSNSSTGFEERWFVDNAECRMQNDELESILIEKNNLINDELDFNDQINSQENITSITYSQKKKK